MPYSLSFRGNFFRLADFIHGLDRMVHASNSKLNVDGRLTTIDGFALSPEPERGFPYLSASFDVTTYLVPPSQGLTAGASSTEPAPVTTAATESSAETSSSSEAEAAQ
jgi:hypothetical protein